MFRHALRHLYRVPCCAVLCVEELRRRRDERRVDCAPRRRRSMDKFAYVSRCKKYEILIINYRKINIDISSFPLESFISAVTVMRHAKLNIHLTHLCWTCSFLLKQVSQRNLILVSESVERLNTQDMEGLPQRKGCSLTQKQTSFLFLAANDFARTVELVESDTQTICVVTES